MEIDVARTLRTTVRTGKVYFGAKRTIKSIINGDAKLVVLASNCPKEIRAEITSKEPVIYDFKGDSTELGSLCGKTYAVLALSVIDVGSSDIMALVKNGDEQ
jgi:large subunit ribosomal protein L30e